MSARMKKPKPVKPRIPLPLKPPKVEPNPKVYTRVDKHKKKWETEREDDAPAAAKDK